jgi:hypothetical protein
MWNGCVILTRWRFGNWRWGFRGENVLKASVFGAE